jgi:UDP-N-acetylmuramyl pentapeptide phosphotransferase/UDP-N-acetylglucosamine-1-phosphate transferase
MWGLIAGVVTLLSWWLTGLLAARSSLLAPINHPNERSLHSEPTPRSGGVAILVSVMIGLGVAAVGYAFQSPSKGFFPKGFASASFWTVSSIALVATVSYLDDRKGLPIQLRFAAQATAAIIVVWAVGLVISVIPIPEIGALSLGWFAGPVSVLFLLWMTNLYNFMDGMDGFAGGMTAIGFGFLAYFGVRAGHPFMFLTATMMSMSTVGFLVHNFPPARIFMGDVGSIPIGFTAGTLALLGVRDGLFDVWVPILIFSPFIVDATVTVLHRAWKRKRIWQAHREHYYQRLVLNGWSHRRTVLAEYGIMLCCGCLAVLYHSTNDRWRLMILAMWALAFTGLAHAVNSLDTRVEGKRR